MALDTFQKRGSAVNLSQSFRPWLVLPTGGINSQSERQSLLKLCASVGTQPPPVDPDTGGGGMSAVGGSLSAVSAFR